MLQYQDSAVAIELEMSIFMVNNPKERQCQIVLKLGWRELCSPHASKVILKIFAQPIRTIEKFPEEK